MRSRIAFILILLTVPALGFGQSTLNFPKLFSAAELPTVGVAVVNPSSSTALVTFNLYSASGQLLTSKDAPPIGPGTQYSKQALEIFTESAGSAGWIQATSSTTGLQGFWINYDAALAQYLDGAETATAFADQVIPLVAGQTELNVANPNASSVSPTIRVYGEAGTELASSLSPAIAAHGVYQGQVATIFSLSATTMTTARYVKITAGSTTPLLATAVLRGYLTTGTETGVINGVSTASTVIDANLPHVVYGNAGGDWVTEVGVTNLAASQQNITLTFTPDTQASACAVNTTSVIRTLAGNGALRDTAKNLFSLPNCFVNGWVKVAASSPITGFAAYTGGSAVAVVPVQPAPSANLVFGHIANQTAVWATGIALLNTSTTSANVEVFAMRSDGSLIGGAQDSPLAKFSLAPGSKYSKNLTEIIPVAGTNPENGGFVFVRTSNNIGLYGIELFYKPILNIISNVAAGALAPGITYTPPDPILPLSLTSVSPIRVAQGGTLTLIGTGFIKNTAGSNVVIFTGASGPIEVPATTATVTTLTVSVPNAAVSGPVQVRVAGQTTNATNTIIDVTATSSTLLQTSVNLAPQQTISNLDIYVPVSTVALNSNQIGLADVGAQATTFAASSAEIARGATKVLAVSGTGITGANGATVSISGAGVTVSGPASFGMLTDGTPFISVTVTVSASAAVGPRNIIVTNSNLDATVVTGGIIIR